MSGVQVEIIGVGAYVAPAGSSALRYFAKGAKPTLSERDAKRLVRNGVGRLVEAAQAEAGGESELSVEEMSFTELKAFAAKCGIDVPGTVRSKAALLALLDQVAADVAAEAAQAEAGGEPEALSGLIGGDDEGDDEGGDAA